MGALPPDFDPSDLFPSTVGKPRRTRKLIGSKAGGAGGGGTNHTTLGTNNVSDMSTSEWARSIMWAVENLNVAKMTRKKAGSAMRLAMWEFGQDDTRNLVVNLMPKAMAILGKDEKKDVDGMESLEEKAILQIEDLMTAAIAEAADDG